MKKIYLAVTILIAAIWSPLYSQTAFSGSPQSVIVETSDSTMILPASNATAGTLNTGSYSGGVIYGWDDGSISWQIKITRTSNITVYANYTTDNDQVHLTFGVNGGTMTGNPTPGTVTWGPYEEFKVGTITLQPGNYVFHMSMTDGVINFDHVHLTRKIVPLTLNASVNNSNFGMIVRTPYRTTYEIDDTVKLTAVSYPGYRLKAWSGDLSSSYLEDTVVMKGNQTVTATFEVGGTIFPDGTGDITLPATTAVVDDEGIALENGIITSWDEGSAFWDIEVPCPDTYILQGEISGPNTSSVSGTLNIALNSLNVLGHYNTSGSGYGNYAYRDLCAVTLQSGTYRVQVNRVLPEAGNDINLKTLRLVKKSTTADDFILQLGVNDILAGTIESSPFKTLYQQDDSVVIIASPAAGYRFVSWSGDLISARQKDMVVMDANKTVTANFELITYTLALNANNAAFGTISVTPNKTSYFAGDSVVIAATPGPGYRFVSWSGDLISAQPTDTIVMNVDKTVTANFEAVPTYMLTLTGNNAAFGTISATPNKTSYFAGDSVVIAATPGPGYRFVSWSGDLISAQPTDTIVMNADKTVTANFEAIPTFMLTLNNHHPGFGTISAFPNKTAYFRGDSVMVTAVPAAGYLFVSWSGDLVSVKLKDTIVMDADKIIAANFEILHTSGTENPMENKLRIYPNPFTRTITIDVTEPLNIQRMELLSPTGKIVWTTSELSADGKQIILQGNGLEALPPGIYFLRVIIRENVVTVKIVKM